MDFGIIGRVALLILFISFFSITAYSQERKGYVIRTKDSVYELTYSSIFKEKPLTVAGRILWYRVGPEAGIFFPTQKRLINRFGNNAISPFGIDFASSFPSSGFSPGADFYYLSSDPLNFPSTEKKDRFFLAGLTAGYRQDFHYTSTGALPYLEIDGEYLLGRLRIKDEHLDTPYKQAGGVRMLGGIVLVDRIKLDFYYTLVTSIDRYNFSGFSGTFTYLFYSVHKKQWFK